MAAWQLTDLLPGLYLVLLGFFLDRALRRWFDPVPGRVWAAFGLALAILLGPALFGGKVLLPLELLTRFTPYESVEPPPGRSNRLQLDLVSQISPALALVRRELREGEWPLWNHLASTGMPLQADPQAQVFQPLIVLAYPFPLSQAAAVTAGLRVLLALVFLYLFLRRLGIGEAPAAAGSLAFGLGGFLQLWLGWPIANTAAWLPVLLYALVRSDERPDRPALLLLTTAFVGLLLAGQPETAVNALLVGGAFALLRLRPWSWRERWRRIGRWGLAAGIAGGLGAPLLLPAADYLPQSHRDVRMERRNDHERQAGFLAGWRKPEERQKSLRSAAQRVLPAAAPNAFGNNRYGPYWGNFNINEDSGAFAGSAALLAALLAVRPWGRRFRHERFFLVLAALSLAVLLRPPGFLALHAWLPILGKSATHQQRVVLFLGLALAVLAACTWERWRRGELGRGPALAGALGIAGLAAWTYLAFGRPPASEPPHSLETLRFGSLSLHLSILAASALLLAGRRRGEIPWAWRGWAVVGLVGLELLIVHVPANPAMPERLYFPTTPPLAFLQQHLAGDRMAAPGAVLQSNASVLYGLADLRHTNPMRPWEVSKVIKPLVSSIDGITDVIVETGHPLYDRLGVRFLLTTAGNPAAPPWRLVFQSPDGWVYERPGALPRMSLPNGTLQLSPIRPARLRAQAQLEQPGRLHSNFYQDGNWHLLVDRRPVPAAGDPFFTASLPAGGHRLDLVYRPRTLLPAVLLAALAAAVALSVFAVPSRGKQVE